jgi:His-Xaa-Ser system protein HxsD
MSDTLLLDTGVYSLEAIKKTAYKFADRASVLLKQEDASNVSATFSFKEGADRSQILADFQNELLDQDLREIVKRETTPLRNLILAHALSRTSLVE